MADYIERQAAIDAFNRIKNTLKNPKTAHYDTLMFYEIEDVLEDVEPADVAPVVWCKDCKSRRVDGYCTRFQNNISGIAVSWFMPEDDDFCSYGERKWE